MDSIVSSSSRMIALDEADFLPAFFFEFGLLPMGLLLLEGTVLPFGYLLDMTVVQYWTHGVAN